MKVLISIITSLFVLWTVPCVAQQSTDIRPDSVRISLLTCSSFEEIYALYGHTALRVEDMRTGDDIVVNYGLFSFGKPFFALRFVFGLTDYEMGVEPYRDFRSKYRYHGCSVIQQELNLTSEEKEAILTALAVNYMPENRVYRYNYFYDNCTTRARNMIVNNISGSVVYGSSDFEGPPFREIVHSCNAHRPWARFGNDLLLGIGADYPTTRDQYQFLPANTMHDFGTAAVIDSTGTERPLVSNTATILEGGEKEQVKEFPPRPMTCAIILLVITIIITTAEYLLHRQFIAYDILLMLSTGLAGIILFAMLFSQHPTVRVNLQLLILNPLPLLLMWRMIIKTRRHKPDRQYMLWIVLIVIFLIGGAVQNYAEGMYVLALSLLIRSVARLYLGGRPQGCAPTTEPDENKKKKQ